MKNTILFLSFLFLLSCSVQKRKYQKGFYVSRVHHKIDEKRRLAPEEKQIKRGERAVQMMPRNNDEMKHGRALAKVEMPDAKENSSLFIPVDRGAYLRSEKNFGRMLKGFDEKENYPINVKHYKPKYGKVHPYAYTALALNILSFLTVIAYLVMLSSTVFVMNVFVLLLGIILVLAILSNIFGNSAKKRIKKRPDLYRGKKLAVTTVILGWSIFEIVVGMAAIAFLLMLVFSGFPI